jgi:Superinfection immunity protein
MDDGLTDQRDRPMATLLAMIAAVFTLGYMAPWMVAAARGRSNHLTVFWLNLLLGWTVVGWIVAMVKAASPHDAVLTGSANS